ncbi:transposase [Paenibacillus puerhi]|uniref:transposase n=1 Tax=Paenibacillus puerhi TaxID=2692622 RepID=UPI0013579957
MQKRNRYTTEFKTKVVLEVLREEQTVNEIAAKYEMSPVMISRWKAEFLECASTVFEKKTSEADKLKKEYESKQEHLEKLVGQLTVEVNWLKKNLALNEPLEARKTIVARDNTEITIKRQTDLLGVNRTSVYRPSNEKRENEENVQIMHRIDEIYVKHPYFGYRRRLDSFETKASRSTVSVYAVSCSTWDSKRSIRSRT